MIQNRFLSAQGPFFSSPRYVLFNKKTNSGSIITSALSRIRSRKSGKVIFDFIPPLCTLGVVPS